MLFIGTLRRLSYMALYKIFRCNVLHHIVLLSMHADDVLVLTSSEQCELSSFSLEDASLDGTSRLLCAFLNTGQSNVLPVLCILSALSTVNIWKQSKGLYFHVLWRPKVYQSLTHHLDCIHSNLLFCFYKKNTASKIVVKYMC